SGVAETDSSESKLNMLCWVQLGYPSGYLRNFARASQVYSAPMPGKFLTCVNGASIIILTQTTGEALLRGLASGFESLCVFAEAWADFSTRTTRLESMTIREGAHSR